MKRFKVFLLVFLAVSFTSAASAQDASVLLGKLTSSMSSMKNYEVYFRVFVEGQNLKGRYVVSGDRFYIQVPDHEVISDGKTKYEINDDEEEVMVDKVDTKGNNILTNPTNAFSFIGSDFTPYYIGEKTYSGKTAQAVKLVPSDKNLPYSAIVVAVQHATGLPVYLEYEVAGSVDNIVVYIDSINSVNDVNESLFKFDKAKYPGYEIIDFR